MNDTPQSLISMLENEIKEEFEKTYQRISFPDYIEELEEHPYQLTRTAYQYIRDTILHFGKSEVKDCGETLVRYHIFDDPFFDGDKKLVGQERPVSELFRHIEACAQQEEDESIFVLIGPPGTGKSRVFYLIEKGLEEYSRTEEGRIFTYNWLFREKFETEESGSLGFSQTMDQLQEENQSYAHLDESEIHSRISCPLRDNPISLIPRSQREQLITKILKQKKQEIQDTISNKQEREKELKKLENFVVPRKIREIEPCRNCQNIRERLLKLYDGDWRKMIKHIEVVPFQFSLERGSGIAEVDPGVNVETNLQPIRKGQKKARVSSMLKGVPLFEFYGKPACAARGMINYQDIFNKNHKQLQHLLSTIEEKTVDFGEVTHKVDFAIFGSTNIPESKLLEENVTTEGLRDRIEQIHVPYLLNYSKEREIYIPNVKEIRKKQHISPHTISIGALYTVLSRMEPVEMEDYIQSRKEELQELKNRNSSRYEKQKELLEKQKQAIEHLDLEQKARIYDNDFSTIPPDYKPAFTDDFVRAIREEHNDSEGREGHSPRWFKRILGELARTDSSRCINPFQLYESIRKHEEDEEVAEERLKLVKKNYHERIMTEVEEALFDVSEDEILERIETYLEHVKASLKNEKVMDPVKGKKVEPDPYLNQEEEFIGIDEEDRDKEEFRESILQKFAGAIEPGIDRPEPKQALPALFQRFKQSIYSERKSDFELDAFVTALATTSFPQDKLFETLQPSKLSEDQNQLKEVYRTINRMREQSKKKMEEKGRDPRAGYCNDCGRKVLEYVLTNQTTREKFMEVAPDQEENDDQDNDNDENQEDDSED